MIEPALTPEEWADEEAFPVRYDDAGRVVVESDCEGFPYGEDVELPRHATAAMCLQGQSFGFTWAEVDALTSAAFICAQEGQDAESLATMSVCRKIEALLPPRTP